MSDRRESVFFELAVTHRQILAMLGDLAPAPIMRHEEMRKRAAPAALPRRHWLRGLSVYEPSGFTTPGSLAVQPASRRL